MQIKTITYRRIKNLGNYENESVEWIAELEEGENPFEATAQLKQDVLTFLNPPRPQQNDDIDYLEF